jgi:predicted acyltransferase
VVFGVVVGRLMRRAGTPRRTVVRLGLLGSAAVGLGVVLAFPVPVNKHLWTPSYAVLTSGLSCLVLLALYELVDRRRWRAWATPLVHLGMNALVVFVFTQAMSVLVLTRLRPRLVAPVADVVGPPAASVLYGVAVCGLAWLLAWLLHRRRVFVRV